MKGDKRGFIPLFLFPYSYLCVNKILNSNMKRIGVNGISGIDKFYSIQIKKEGSWGQAIAYIADRDSGYVDEVTLLFDNEENALEEYDFILENFPKEEVRMVTIHKVSYKTRSKLPSSGLSLLFDIS